ncbi:hypothetical protein C1H46_027340 [Malus baccata]|uniref:RRM domain-containing protein n=1 Tax=Malus baccata TaxID=106549 RepID=A0A540LKW3_MALBA|nr:hypothetical protein C1H46_027340 [Malus baccata]
MMQQPSGGLVPQQIPSDPQQQYQQQPPQQWMMMPPQQQGQAPPAQAGWPQQAPQQYATTQNPGPDEIRSLWIGDLLQWMDEAYILSCFGPTGEAVNAKVIRNKLTGLPEGYGFIEFRSRAAAEQILQTYNGALMPNTEQNFRLNWATLGAGERRQDDGPDFTVFVGDLAADVTDYMLQETFRQNYHSVKGAKVVTDRTTGRSKGYGFVRFADEGEQLRAMTEMNGQFCSTRPMRIGPAATKKPASGGQQYQKDVCSVLVLYEFFAPYVNYGLLRIQVLKEIQAKLIQIIQQSCAEQALGSLNGTQLGGQSIRLSWGRSPTSKQNQPDQAQWNGAGGAGFYGYPQGYDAYSYAPPPAQDPALYYGGYAAGYGNYQQPGAYQQQQQLPASYVESWGYHRAAVVSCCGVHINFQSLFSFSLLCSSFPPLIAPNPIRDSGYRFSQTAPQSSLLLHEDAFIAIPKHPPFFTMMQQPSGGLVPQQIPSDPQQQYQQQPPQQWMMMPPQQQGQAPPAQAGWPQQAPQQYATTQNPGPDEIRSLWIGDLLQWMDEAYILSCFGPTGEAVNAKVIRNKLTGLPEGYGFIEFRSRAAAEQILQTYNGALMPNTEQNFRLNWATLGAGERRQDDGPDFTVFVGDLAADVTDYMLQETFRQNYHSVKGAKVVTDRTTGRSKGYGFVRFADEGEQLRAMTEMNGQFCSTRPMRIGPAATKKPASGGQQYQKDVCSVLVLYEFFAPYVNYGLLRIQVLKEIQAKLIQIIQQSCAEQALGSLNGTQLGGQSIRLSWGRSPTSKQNQPDQAQWNGAGGAGFYGYPQGYDAYSYAPPPAQDPALYYGGYAAGYGNYQQPGAYQQQQQVTIITRLNAVLLLDIELGVFMIANLLPPLQ